MGCDFLSVGLTTLAIRDETGLRSTLLNRESKEEKMHSRTGFEKFLPLTNMRDKSGWVDKYELRTPLSNAYHAKSL